MSVDRCVSCGAVVPEGTQVCINCQKNRRFTKGNSMRHELNILLRTRANIHMKHRLRYRIMVALVRLTDER